MYRQERILSAEKAPLCPLNQKKASVRNQVENKREEVKSRALTPSINIPMAIFYIIMSQIIDVN